MKSADSGRSCLGCSGKTKRVGAETVTSLVALRKAQDNDGFRFCPAPKCDVVYSQRATDTRVSTSALDVEVFQKSSSPDRPVCYCFEHTVRDVEADAAAIIDDIEAKCREGIDRCEELNPQGRCCLGNVRDVADNTGDILEPGAGAPAVAHNCCASTHVSEAPSPPSTEAVSLESAPRGGRWATGGAVVAAVLSSACCWLPLSLVALGISAGGVGAVFEEYRVVLLGATAALLGAGFYFAYIRKPACEPGEACAVPNSRLQRFNKVMLWVATAFVAGFALFPNYIGSILGGGEQPTAEAATLAVADPTAANPDAVTRTYSVEGMSCEGCTVHIKETLEKLSIVSSATIVYEDKIARVTFTPGTDPDDAAVLAAIDETGFEATVNDNGEN
jgi:copper chaperone CopZ